MNPLEPVVLTSLVYTTSTFTFTVNGPLGPDYIIAASTNLTEWTDLVINPAPTTPFHYSDTNAPFTNKRFYRAVLAPEGTLFVKNERLAICCLMINKERNAIVY